ncbi:glycosyltransferase [Paraburkholderia caballeronis]|uniref:Glycosyl transferase family 2 n=1 Tax=Paraburkholderia caballeronis TaxID=416943 RepID=A0A1H7JZ33_9BURK|nr:glycosyltransferase [Paraburkholderia caballeronis]PXW27239.1 glycosyl transferase family 2 [Paraburkholderia caballeronis]PXX02713.1 glycosyl transferase family 2 [Paraburkholderia caballeronis]RAK03438.1 glycosyl transferase family 2 [Paraburkholderia caballeronis]TDV17101.1 glycosyl transferase family 2 [Paraburkholderia caballeronis]TDV17486.1 glycosyl transferase family 2 [Paraburkholderia caballeronis]
MKSVSVAMATCNGEKYLAAQLDSLARQTRPPAELVVTDDSSADATLDILADFSYRAPFPVRVYANAERLGYRANFMRAVSLCKSDFVSFCDQDDVWFDDKLARCMARLDASDALLLSHNAIVTDSALAEIDTLAKDALAQPDNPPLSIDPLKYGLGFTLLFDRRLAQFEPLWQRSIDFNDGSSKEGHDQWFFFLANALGPVLYIDAPLAHYRRHTNTATRTTWAGASSAAQALHYLFECLPRWANHATGCEHRAAVLDAIAADPSSPYAAAARAGAERYRAYARLYRERIELYNATSVIERSRRFAAILSSGGYRNGDVWAKGTKSACKDLLAGVLRLSHVMPATARTRLRGY